MARQVVLDTAQPTIIENEQICSSISELFPAKSMGRKMKIFEYDSLKSEKLEEALKANGEFSILFSRSRGKRCVVLLELLKKALSYDKSTDSLISRILFVCSGLLEVIRVWVFHSNLLEVLIFFYQNKPLLHVHDHNNDQVNFHFKAKGKLKGK